MNHDKLGHMIYSSTAAPGLQASELASILQVSRDNNARRGITGMLLHTTGTFFQVLEGEDAALHAVFGTIAADARHSGVTMIISEPIAGRAFGDWTMGFADIAHEDLERMDGVSDFFQPGHATADIRPGRAKKILAAFAQGRWRARLG